MSLIQDKIANPLNFYKNPLEVDADTSASRADKIKILLSWLNDIDLRHIAEAENMPPTHPSFDHVVTIERLLREYTHTTD